MCFERLTKRIPVCLQGHHVCSKCCCQMNICPVCKELFSGTRNYLAESLLVKFDEIKVNISGTWFLIFFSLTNILNQNNYSFLQSSLIDPRHDLNQSDLQNKICVSTQTEIATETDNSINNNNQPTLITKCSNTGITYLFKEGPAVGKGKYPCRIGSCHEELPHGRMIPHIRYYHKEHIVEVKYR